MFIDNNLQFEIKKLSLETPKSEICGLISINSNHELQLVPCQNVSPRPSEHFIIKSQDYLKASSIGNIVALYHSHADNSNFSELDKINSTGNNLISIVYDIKSDSFNEFHPKTYISPYIGKSFKIGENDCFSLIQNYYKNELNIQINDYFRDESWFRNNPESYDKNYSNEGFIKVIDRIIDNSNIHLLKTYDIILFRYGRTQNIDHAAIYLQGGFILHHARDRFSNIEPFDESHQRRVGFVARHKSL